MGGEAFAELDCGRAVGEGRQTGGDVGQAVVDPHGLHAVGAVEELVPGGQGGLGVAAFELDVAEVGEDDEPDGAAPAGAADAANLMTSAASRPTACQLARIQALDVPQRALSERRQPGLAEHPGDLLQSV